MFGSIHILLLSVVSRLSNLSRTPFVTTEKRLYLNLYIKRNSVLVYYYQLFCITVAEKLVNLSLPFNYIVFHMHKFRHILIYLFRCTELYKNGK